VLALAKAGGCPGRAQRTRDCGGGGVGGAGGAGGGPTIFHWILLFLWITRPGELAAGIGRDRAISSDERWVLSYISSDEPSDTLGCFIGKVTGFFGIFHRISHQVLWDISSDKSSGSLGYFIG
jgi:hypothetical protein